MSVRASPPPRTKAQVALDAATAAEVEAANSISASTRARSRSRSTSGKGNSHHHSTSNADANAEQSHSLIDKKSSNNNTSSSSEQPLASPTKRVATSRVYDASVGKSATSATLFNSSESRAEFYIRIYCCEPLCDYVIPSWLSPNYITYTNAAGCWTLLGLGYISAFTEQHYPVMTLLMRLLMAVLTVCSIVLDCLDGYQARRTGQCSTLGELLDHTLDAANACIMACAMLLILQPDIYTIMIGLVCTGSIYNAQLVLYRHTHTMINPPVDGIHAQAICTLSIIALALLFFILPRSALLCRIVIIAYSIGANGGQVSNEYFFIRKLLLSKRDACVAHLAFVVPCVVCTALLWFGILHPFVYIFVSIMISYRQSSQYLLYTLLRKKLTALGRTDEVVELRYAQGDSQLNRQTVAWLIALFTVGVMHVQWLTYVTAFIACLHMHFEIIRDIWSYKALLTQKEAPKQSPNKLIDANT